MNRTALAAASLIALTLSAGPAAAAPRVEVGVLRCHGGESVNYIFASKQEFRCTFDRLHGSRERYTATIRHYGVELGITDRSLLVWRVFAPARSFADDALAGNYGGASASAAVIYGVGANVLIGGSNSSFALQPLSLEGQRGVNAMAGITDLTLSPE